MAERSAFLKYMYKQWYEDIQVSHNNVYIAMWLCRFYTRHVYTLQVHIHVHVHVHVSRYMYMYMYR